jgi:hypothetical protein
LPVCGALHRRCGSQRLSRVENSVHRLILMARVGRIVQRKKRGELNGGSTRALRVSSATPSSLTSVNGFSEGAETRTRGRARSPEYWPVRHYFQIRALSLKRSSYFSGG